MVASLRAMNWLNPVSLWHGHVPVVSDGYSPAKTAGHREHHGVDVMFRRLTSEASPDRVYPAGTPNGTRDYFMPDGVPVLAAADGVLWSSSVSARGHSVVLDHGNPWATFYQHMEELFVPLGVTKGNGGIRVVRGQPIGIVGASSLDGEKLKHLHFEMWKGGGAESHVDPQREGFNSWPTSTVAESFAGVLAQFAAPAAVLAACWYCGKMPLKLGTGV